MASLSFSRTTPLRSAGGGRQDVLASVTTQWGTTALGSFTAQYADPRGWRTGQDSGISTGAPAGSWSQVLNLGDGVKAGTATFDGFGQLAATGTPTWQLTSGSQNLGLRTLSWTYDLAGNRTTEVDSGGTTNYSTTATNPNANGALNEYTAITGQRSEATLAYDADGNLTQDGTWTYAYDGENRLKSAIKTGQTLTFMYDYLGRRIAKTVGGTTITFLWSGWQLAAQLASDGITPQKAFVGVAIFRMLAEPPAAPAGCSRRSTRAQ